MIDSKISDVNGKNYEKMSNMSRSNVGSASQHNLKTGQAVRGKDKER